MFPGIITLLFAAAAAFVAGIVVATYFERGRTVAERAGHEKSAKTLQDQLTDTLQARQAGIGSVANRLLAWRQ